MACFPATGRRLTFLISFLLCDLGICVQYAIEPPSETLPINMNVSGSQRIYCHASDNSIPLWHINGTFYASNNGFPNIVQRTSFEYRGQQLYVYLDFSNLQQAPQTLNLKCGGASGTEWSNNITLVWLNRVPNFFACNLTVMDRMVSWDHCVNPLDCITSYKFVVNSSTMRKNGTTTDTKFHLDCNTDCQVSVYPINFVGEGVPATKMFFAPLFVTAATEITRNVTTSVSMSTKTTLNASPVSTTENEKNRNASPISEGGVAAIGVVVVVLVVLVVVILVGVVVAVRIFTRRPINKIKEMESDRNSNSSSTQSNEKVQGIATSGKIGVNSSINSSGSQDSDRDSNSSSTPSNEQMYENATSSEQKQVSSHSDDMRE